jgi:hypothetical protein
MKRVLALLAGFLVLLPGVCGASGYVMVNYGYGGKVDNPSLGVELGGVFLSSLHPSGGALSVGLGVSVADTDDNPPASKTVFPVPPLSHRTDFNDGNEQEINAVFGAELMPSLFAVVGAGYSTQDTVTLGVNSGKVYEADSGTDKNATFMLGLRYVVQGLDLGLGFHTRRGIMAGVGIAF